MLVNSISSVRFCGETAASGSSSILERPGKYSSSASASTQEAPAAPAQEEKKSSGTGRKIAGAVVTLAVIAAALAATPKIFPKLKLDEAQLAQKPGFMKKVGHYIALAGEKIARYTYEPIVNLFKRGKAEAPKKTEGDARIFA